MDGVLKGVRAAAARPRRACQCQSAAGRFAPAPTGLQIAQAVAGVGGPGRRRNCRLVEQPRPGLRHPRQGWRTEGRIHRLHGQHLVHLGVHRVGRHDVEQPRPGRLVRASPCQPAWLSARRSSAPGSGVHSMSSDEVSRCTWGAAVAVEMTSFMVSFRPRAARLRHGSSHRAAASAARAGRRSDVRHSPSRRRRRRPGNRATRLGCSGRYSRLVNCALAAAALHAACKAFSAGSWGSSLTWASAGRFGNVPMRLLAAASAALREVGEGARPASAGTSPGAEPAHVDPASISRTRLRQQS